MILIEKSYNKAPTPTESHFLVVVEKNTSKNVSVCLFSFVVPFGFITDLIDLSFKNRQ